MKIPAPLVRTPRLWLALIAVAIVAATLLYTNSLAQRLAAEEKKDVAQWAEAIRAVSAPDAPEADFSFHTRVIEENTTIPVVMTDERGAIVSQANVAVPKGRDSLQYLRSKLVEFRGSHPRIVVNYGSGRNYVYYGESYLLKQLRYFPYVQLGVILLFLSMVLMALGAANRAIQNQVWVGLSKETAHQLGTPLTAIEGWLELLADRPENSEAVTEARKDLGRLKLIADRFGKVGSQPQLVREDLLPRLADMVEYMQRRAPSRVKISLRADVSSAPVMLSGPLFDWVVENLIRNALDALDGRGAIGLHVHANGPLFLVDVSDTGKGIPRGLVRKVFSPGFTTKKRGWGLGLSLSKRIVEEYHRGSLAVLRSEVGKGTTFRITVRRAE